MSSLAGLVNYSDDEGSSSSGDEAPGSGINQMISKRVCIDTLN